MCVLVVPPFVPVVAALFSDVNVDCEVVFSDPECEIVEPQNLSLSSTREASVVLERETTQTMEVEDVNPPRTAPERVLIDKVSNTWRKVKVSKFTDLEHFYAWTRRCGHSSRSLQVRETNVVVKKFVSLDTDAVRYVNGADHLWTAQDRAELREQEKNGAKFPESTPEFDAVCRARTNGRQGKESSSKE